MAAKAWIKDGTIKIGGGKVCIAEACPCGDPCCEHCDPLPNITADLTGFALTDIGACDDCPGLTDLFVLTRIGSSCAWSYSTNAYCGGGSFVHTIGLTITESGGECVWTLTIILSGGLSFRRFTFTVTDPSECVSPLTLGSPTGVATLGCGGTYASTVDLTW